MALWNVPAFQVRMLSRGCESLRVKKGGFREKGDGGGVRRFEVAARSVSAAGFVMRSGQASIGTTRRRPRVEGEGRLPVCLGWQQSGTPSHVQWSSPER